MNAIVHDRRSSRGGSLVVEAVIAITLLATALISLAKLGATASAMQQQSDSQLSAVLVAENALERLRAVQIDDLSDQAATIAEAMQQSSGLDVTARAEPFSVGQREAIHVIVQVRSGAAMKVTMHDWRVGPEDAEENSDE